MCRVKALDQAPSVPAPEVHLHFGPGEEDIIQRVEKALPGRRAGDPLET